MVEIQLDKKYWILSDVHQWILATKDAKRFWNISYHARLSQLLEEYIDKRTRDNKNIKTLGELLDYQKSLIAGLCKVQQLKIEVL